MDTALLIFAGNAERGEIRLPLLGLVLLITYNNLNWQLMSFVNLRSEMKLTRVYRSQVVEKRARLEYRCVEDNETWDLINRTCTDPVGKIRGGFDSLTGAAGIVLRVGSLLSILMAQVFWAGIAIVAMSVPLFVLAVRSGKEIYEENKEAMKFTRRADYLRGVLQGRDSVEERALFGYTDEDVTQTRGCGAGVYGRTRILNTKKGGRKPSFFLIFISRIRPDQRRILCRSDDLVAGSGIDLRHRHGQSRRDMLQRNGIAPGSGVGHALHLFVPNHLILIHAHHTEHKSGRSQRLHYNSAGAL